MNSEAKSNHLGPNYIPATPKHIPQLFCGSVSSCTKWDNKNSCLIGLSNRKELIFINTQDCYLANSKHHIGGY